METLSINYLAVVVGAVLSMVIGALWYGPLFGKKWMKIIGVNPDDFEARKKMQKNAMPLYLIQLVLTLFQVLSLAHLVAEIIFSFGRNSIYVIISQTGFMLSGRNCRQQ